MLALKHISEGEEILNDYGEVPRSDMLRRYGFVTDRYQQWDVVELDIESIVQTATIVKGISEQEILQKAGPQNLNLYSEFLS